MLKGFWETIPEDCKKAIQDLKRLKVHKAAGCDLQAGETSFANVWWLILHEVDMYDEGIFRRETDAEESDPEYVSRQQANSARRWLVIYESLFAKYAKLLPDQPYGDGEHICYRTEPI